LDKYTTSNKDINVLSNGEINYTLKGVHAKVSVIWNYQAPAGTGDTHYSIMRGTKANLVIRQGAEQQYKPTLYIEPIQNNTASAENVEKVMKIVTKQFPGISIKKNATGWEVVIPESYKDGHEAHFGKVTEKYLDYLANHNMPNWEIPNMIAKYYTTTQAQKLAAKK
jgi:hypothetical protein